MPETNPPQPTNYSPSTHFLQVASRSLNKEIRDFFDPKGDFDDTNISTPEAALKRACLMDPEEGLLLNIGKMIFYGLMTGKLSQDIGDQFYGTPKTSFKEFFRYLDVQLIFMFKESRQDAVRLNRTRNPLDMRLSFRLMTKSEQLTQSDITQLQNRITANFTGSYGHPKGLTKFSYNDPQNGFSGTYINAVNRGDAVEIYKKLCNVSQVTFEDSFLSESSKRSFKTETKIVLGESTRKTNKPRTGKVYLQKVTLVLPNNQDRVLVNRVGDKLIKTAFD